MSSNSAPLARRDTDSVSLLMRIVSKTETGMTVEVAADETQHPSNLSIGALLSDDRQTVYWQNNTNPLP